jgi:cold shock protein
MITGTVLSYNDQKGLRFHSAGQLRSGLFVHATALERAAISGLREGQEVKFDKGIDPRSGKAAVATIEIA